METKVTIHKITLKNLEKYEIDIRQPSKLNVEESSINVYGFVFNKSNKPIKHIIVTSKALFNRRIIGESELKASPGFFKIHPSFPVAKKAKIDLRIFPSFLMMEDSIYINVVLTDNTQETIAILDVTVSNDIKNIYNEKISPIKLLSLGRTGTTLFMNMLSAHPKIGINNHFNESNIASYYLNNLEHNYPFVQKNNYGEGKANLENIQTIQNKDFMEFPFITDDNWYTDLFPKHLVRFVKSTIDDYYLNCSDNNDINYFIEKGVVHDPTLTPMDQLYSKPKYIFLVRDFRDMYASIINFNKKRGFRAFGMEKYEKDEDYIVALGRYCENSFISAYEALKDRAILVKYEDLVSNKRATLKRIFDYLNINSADIILDEVITKTSGKSKVEKKHMTTHNVNKSIGRYKESLNQNTIDILNKSFDKSLRYFNYIGND